MSRLSLRAPLGTHTPVVNVCMSNVEIEATTCTARNTYTCSKVVNQQCSSSKGVMTNVCVYIYVYIHIYTYMYLYIYMYIRICVCMYT